MNTTETRWGPGENAEAIQAWDGPLYDRWIKFRRLARINIIPDIDERMKEIQSDPERWLVPDAPSRSMGPRVRVAPGRSRRG